MAAGLKSTGGRFARSLPQKAKGRVPEGTRPAQVVNDTFACSYLRMQPVLSVIAFGQVTGLKLTVGLSAFKNQSKRQLQPALN